MYLHKDGCEHFILVFKNFYLLGERYLDRNRNQIESISSSNMISNSMASGASEPATHLKKLLKHIEDIEEHVKDEDNDVVKNHINNVYDAIGKRFTNPLTEHLHSAHQDLTSLSKQFDIIKRNITSALENISAQEKSKASDLLLNYENIYKGLENVSSISFRIAEKLRTVITALEKEKEFIIKEEEKATDFTKNLMSWF